MLSDDDPENEFCITFTAQQKKMVCFWPLYENYRENLRIKGCVIDLKQKDSKVIIKSFCKETDVNVQKELHDLFDKFNISFYGCHHFFVTKIISVRKSYFVANRLQEKNAESKTRGNFGVFRPYRRLSKSETAIVVVSCQSNLLPFN